MQQIQPHTVTRLLLDWRDGDQAALDQLLPLVYQELHRRAMIFMSRESPGHTLQPTALINEVYLRLVDQSQVACEDRNGFLAVCANLMKQILVDMARARTAAKRGGGLPQAPLEEAMLASRNPDAELLALNDALDALSALNGRQGRVVVLRYFGGLTVEETAQALDVSPETVKRDWKLAKVWLFRELNRKRSEVNYDPRTA
ncbi:MAG TPA: sigma-70 family RNA polymerase sigma factor [Blastocatellia bacterium]|nr:sigma-70 family RNA polymerase sigma factor [Blastocatellia bacterium]